MSKNLHTSVSTSLVPKSRLTVRDSDSASSKRSRSSLNAKYDRMLGNTHSLRTGRGSLETIKQVEEEKRKLDEERQRKRDEEQQALFKKLGIVASPGFASKAKRTTEQVVADLQKYRLGNVKPVKPVSRSLVCAWHRIPFC